MKYLMMVCFMAMNATGWAAEPEQVEAFTAKLFNSKGTVEHLKKGTSTWATIKAPFMLEIGDQVKTGPKSRADIYIKYGSKIRLGADTVFVIGNVAPEGNTVEVLRGKMNAWIRKFVGRGFTVRTPSAVCAVRGTVFGVEVSEAGQTTWDLFSGSIQVADNRNRTIDLQPNQRLQVTQAEGVATPVALPAEVKAPSEPPKIKEEKTEIKAEQVFIEQQAAAAVAPVAPTEEVKEEAAPAEEAAPVDETVVPVVVEPVTTVIPTQTVIETTEMSPSNP